MEEDPRGESVGDICNALNDTNNFLNEYES